MRKTFYAVFDGAAFRPDQPLQIAPQTRVRLTIETEQVEKRSARSFLDIAEGLNLDGPPDWSSRVDDYLYSPRSATWK
ncbi:MAG: hypothetical protein KY467_15610 [Gemmatimonadetes bacterium]|nr:hypothetical protein [Gemmatimonadota bacterium]